MAKPSSKLLLALDARERYLRDVIAERRAALRTDSPLPEPAGDIADMAFDRMHANVEHDLIERSLGELAELAAARERMANGTYGECVDCGETIAPARLRINPTASRCAACQELHERRAGGL